MKSVVFSNDIFFPKYLLLPLFLKQEVFEREKLEAMNVSVPPARCFFFPVEKKADDNSHYILMIWLL